MREIYNLIILLFISTTVFGQENQNENENISDSLKIVKLQKEIVQINKLYKSLNGAAENIQNQTSQGFQSINDKLDMFSTEIESKYSTIKSRTDKIEEKAEISDDEREEYLSQSIDKIHTVIDNFYQYIKFYGDKYSQLDEKVTSEELSLEMRKIINPQSGSLGFKLSDKLYKSMSVNFNSLVDEIIVDKSKRKKSTKARIDNTLQVATSILDNKVVSNMIGMIPYGSNIKNIVSTASGLLLNIFDSKNIKPEFRNKLIDKVKKSQVDILDHMNEIIIFYDKMAKLYNDYQIALQAIRTDVDILGIELLEFCKSLETPLQKIDASFVIDQTKSPREIAIQLSDKFESLKDNKSKIKDNLSIMTSVSIEIKTRSRTLYNKYREIQESKIYANNYFVGKFQKVVGESNINDITEDVVQKLADKNNELIEKMNNNHVIDKGEFEKWLVKIMELN